MLLFGTNIQSAADELRKVQEEYLYNSLRNPKPTIAATIKQLRIIYGMDKNGYNQLKRKLPYFVCGQFNPPFRRKENFAYTENFILDFDHLSSKQLSLKEVREKIIQDQQVLMCFASPSEDGIKVMFRLKERCYDAGIYSIFYKAFAATFAMRHNLMQVSDSKTSDKEILECIRQKLNPKSSPKTETKQAFVPERLNEIIDNLKQFIEATGVQVTEIINIQYAKKIRARLGQREAEINLFYGKRGFSVVISPRSGTNEELNDLLAEIVNNFLQQ